MSRPLPSLRVDWFSASVPDEPGPMVGWFAERLEGEPRNVRALNGYTHACAVMVGQEERVRVQWSNEGRPNVLARGANAHQVFELVRGRYLDYSVARVDVAVDLDDADWFEVIHGTMRRLSHERQIKHHIRGDWETPGHPDGRTTYAGALGKSAVVRRLYEYAKCHGYGMPVRYEIEIKPPSKYKASYAGKSALDLFCSDGYSVELFRRLGFATDRYMVALRERETPAARWFTHLVRQYGPKLLEMVKHELEGDISELGIQIIRHYEADCEAREKVRRIARHAAAPNSLERSGEGGDCQGLATFGRVGH